MSLRTQRFALHVPMRYRINGETAWRQGKTENVSQTGVLFSAERLLRVNTPVEVKFQMILLPPLNFAALADVICRGRIVRAESALDTAARAILAATISDYSFVPAADGLPLQDESHQAKCALPN